jgi:hypothetical protein
MTRVSNVQAPLAPARPQSAGPVNQHTLLELGSTGPEVKQLQGLLMDRGLMKPPATGSFDAKTQEAVKAFQQANNLKVDGVVGQQTWGAFNGESFPPGSSMLKKVSGGFTGSSDFSKPTPGGSNPATPTPVAGTVTPADGSAAERVLAEARAHVGFHEGAGNNNPFSHALGRPSEKWCADYVSYCAKKAGLTLDTASAQGVQDFLTAKGTWKGKTNPQPGDAVTFDWSGRNGHADHVGMVERVYQRNGKIYIDTIEGNSSDSVKRNTYAIDNPAIKGFGRIV